LQPLSQHQEYLDIELQENKESKILTDISSSYHRKFTNERLVFITRLV